MKKTTLFTTHKKASITIIVILAISFLYNYNSYFPDGFSIALRTEPTFVIGFILAQIVMFFILFGIYYFIRSIVVKIKEKKRCLWLSGELGSSQIGCGMVRYCLVG